MRHGLKEGSQNGRQAGDFEKQSEVIHANIFLHEVVLGDDKIGEKQFNQCELRSLTRSCIVSS
jgi:hypothetical protein